MATKNYTSIYQIKDFIINEIAPKYLATAEMNMSSTGLFGYITETLANLGEDGLNMTSMVFKECFANAAENPESLYLMAAIFQLEDLFATPAQMPFVLLLSEQDIIARSREKNNFKEFNIDAATSFYIDNVPFLLEYDVRITSKKDKNGYTHAATYVIDHKSSIAKVASQYLPSKTFIYNGITYVAVQVNLRQMTMMEFNETIISNDKINVSSFDFHLDPTSAIAGFEAYYTPPYGTEVQLEKRLQNTPKVSAPFCYYTLASEGVLRIEFSNDERYFVPEFNSTLRVVVYMTNGASGNFARYRGDDIVIQPVSTKYPEDNGIILLGQVSSASVGGKNRMTTEELRDAVIMAQSTVKVFNTSNDLQLYFKRMANSTNTKIMFMKRRDDALIRLFNAFTLLIDEENIVIPTNTVDALIEEEDIDADYPETYRSVVKAGKLYRYGPAGFVTIDRSLTMASDLDALENDFVYVNPFLTIMSSSPVNLGLYLNSIASDISLDINYVNSDSFVQFMTSTLTINRNALLGQSEYTLEIKVLPTTSKLENCITLITPDMRVPPGSKTFLNPHDGKEYIDNQLIRVLLMLEDGGVETCYVPFELFNYDQDYFYFRAKIKTDDYISTSGKIKLINSVYDTETNVLQSEKFVPAKSLIGNIGVFYKYTDQANGNHKYSTLTPVNGFTLTNIYRSETNRIDFIIPLEAINACLKYNQYIGPGGVKKYNYKLLSMPMVKANYVKDPERFRSFVDNFTSIYKYLNAEIDLLTNNFSIDIKFYNTYGKSKNYEVANGVLDKVNLTLRLQIKPYYTTDSENLVRDVKEFILNDIKSGFDSAGNNSIYISNLIRKIETNFADKIEYIIYRGINSYDLSVQKLEPRVNDGNLAEYYSSMQDYVPEYINVYYQFKEGKRTPQILVDVI